MAFREGSAYTGVNRSNIFDEDVVISNDGSMHFFDGQKGSFRESTRSSYTVSFQNFYFSSWNGGFDYRLLNANTAFKITASDGAASDQFGHSVAAGSGVIVIGAPGDDDNGSSSGSVYLRNIKGAAIAKVKPSDGAAGDNFGHSVAAGSNRIVVGAPGDDDGGGSSGSAYIFDLAGSNQVKIIAPDDQASAEFGSSVAIGCNRVVVGAPGDNLSTHTGSVYIFKRDGTFIRKITSPNADGVKFGYSVSVNLGRIVVGDPYSKYNGTDSGTAYIFDLEGNFLTQINGKILSGETNTMTITSYVTNNTTTVTGNISSGTPMPVVGQYITISGATSSTSLNGTWRVLTVPTSTSFTFQVTNTIASATRTTNLGTTTFVNKSNDNFGWSVSIGSGRIAVGSIGQVVYTNLNDRPSQGIAELFDLGGTHVSIANATTGFVGTSTLRADGTSYNTPLHLTGIGLNNSLGYSVAIGSGYLVCGVPYQDINSVTDSGSALLFNCKTTNHQLSNNTETTSVGFLDKNLISLYPNASTLFPNTTNTASDAFGFSVACSWDTIVIGCPLENTPAGVDAGAVYVFKIAENTNGYYEKILDSYGKDD
jgi:hypothetical protein